LAAQSYELALDIQTQLVADHPDNVLFRKELKGTLNNRGILLKATGRLDEALKTYKALRSHQAQVMIDEPEQRVEHELGTLGCDINTALVLQQLGRIDAAESLMRRSRQELRHLSPQESEYYHPNWFLSGLVHARLLREMGRVEEAERICEEALGQSFMLVHESPDDRENQRLYASLVRELGGILAATGRLEEAEQKLRESLERQQRALPFGMTPREYDLATMGGNVENRFEEPSAFCEYADTQCSLGLVLNRLGKQEEAERLIDEAERTCRVRAQLSPHILRCRHSRASALLMLANLRSQTRPLEARDLYDQAIAIWTELLHRAPQVFEYSVHLTKSRYQLAWLLITCYEESVRDPVQALQLAKKAVATDTERGDFRSVLGAAYLCVGEPEKALETLRESSNLQGADVTTVGFLLAMAHWQLGDRDEAIETFGQAQRRVSSRGAGSGDARLLHVRTEAARMLGLQRRGMEEVKPMSERDGASTPTARTDASTQPKAALTTVGPINTERK
jgi:tetratricopeptide (TPR) repeat protein